MHRTFAAEVLSPHDAWSVVIETVDDYLAAGTLMVVLVDPRPHIVHVFRPAAPLLRLGAVEVLDGGDVVPGWRLPLRDLFAL